MKKAVKTFTAFKKQIIIGIITTIKVNNIYVWLPKHVLQINVME